MVTQLSYLVVIMSIVATIAIGRLCYPIQERVTLHEWMRACWLPMLVYIVWDIGVSGWWWEFESARTLSIRILGLPPSEYLFFITVSYGCLQLWKSGSLRLSHLKNKHTPKLAYPLAGAALATYGLFSLHQGLWYTSVVSLLSSICLFASVRSMLFKSYLFVVLIAITWLLTLIFNTPLTFIPVVSYLQNIKSGILLGTIPIEDFLYIYPFIWSIIYFHSKSRNA